MMGNNKVLTLETLAELVNDLRANGKKIVHCHGVFDLLHIGHIRYFEQAREMGDVLVVTLTPDRFVDKGPHRPAFPENLRAEAIASLICVDYVAINSWPTAEETLRLLQPHYYVKGSEFKNISSDMTGKIGREEQVVREIGATLAFTEDIVFSSSNLINRYISSFPEDIQQYLDLMRQRYDVNEVLGVLEKMASLKVLVIGDTILDEYQYCDAIGKSSKDPVIALKYRSHDLFAGGVLAVANHVANFVDQVRLVTILGEKDDHEPFIRSQLRPNVSPAFFTQPGSPTALKRRFVDGYTLNKLFEVYVMDDSGLSADRETEVCRLLREEASAYDLVIAADFGHGAITDCVVTALTENSRYLAVNTQANAGNRGFHTVSRYPRADYVCLAEHEIRLEMRNLTDNVRPLMDRVGRSLDCSRLVVTRGRHGCIVRDREGEFVEVPSFAQKVVDRVGAGDAFFSVTALAAMQGASNELIGFLGNVVGSLAVEIVGNQKSIDALSVKKYIVSLMK